MGTDSFRRTPPPTDECDHGLFWRGSHSPIVECNDCGLTWVEEETP